MTDPHDRWRALDAPFTDPDDWTPIPGTCSRCGQPAYLGTSRWWHLGETCPARGRQADFLPGKLPCPDCGDSRDCSACEGHGQRDGDDCPTCESYGICPACREHPI